jgi:CelD/BcsL family acetyltransferase involved in cellulose biosynthesis
MKIGMVEIGENAEEYFKRLDGNFRRELRRRSRRLEEDVGAPKVSLTMDGNEVDRAHLEGFSLEVRGWKGRAHSAVLQDPTTNGYFRALSHAAASQHALAMVSVAVGERLIFFHYCLRAGEEAYLFKTAHDEDFQTYGVGQLGTMHTLKTLHERGVRKFNFFGLYVPWQEPWQPTLTQYAKVVIARRETPATCAMTQYRIYASVKRSPWLYRTLNAMRKYYYIAITVRDTIRALVKHLR